MRPLRSIGLVLGCALIACGGTPPAPATSPPAAAPTDDPAPAGDPGARGHDKPSAPIELTMVARQVAGSGDVDRFQVTLSAIPSRDLERVELSIDGRPSEVAAVTAAGAPSHVMATIDVSRGEGKDVIGTATIVVDGRRMGAATQLRIGAPDAAAPAGTIIHLPDGTPVQEVRP